jgi:hypothetical protein
VNIDFEPLALVVGAWTEVNPKGGVAAGPLVRFFVPGGLEVQFDNGTRRHLKVDSTVTAEIGPGAAAQLASKLLAQLTAMGYDHDGQPSP